MKSIIYASITVLALLTANVAYASPEKLTEDELAAVLDAVCSSSGSLSKSELEDSVEYFLDTEVDSNTINTMDKLAEQFEVLPETTVEMICGY